MKKLTKFPLNGYVIGKGWSSDRLFFYSKVIRTEG